MGSVVSTELVPAYQFEQKPALPVCLNDISLPALQQLQEIVHPDQIQDAEARYYLKRALPPQVHQIGAYYGNLQGGKRHGLGIQCYPGRAFSVANFEQDQIKGSALVLFCDNTVFFGDWSEAQLLGSQGLLYTTDRKVFCGQFTQKAEITLGYFDAEEFVYLGTFSRGKRDGVGRCLFASGEEYEGQWSKDQMSGQGVIRFADGSYYVGGFTRNLPDKAGLEVKADLRYIGEFSMGKYDGLGRLVRGQKKTKTLEGCWKQGQPNGLYCEYENPKEKQWQYAGEENSEVLKATKKLELLKLRSFRQKEITSFEQLEKAVIASQDELSAKIKKPLEIAEYYQRRLEEFRRRMGEYAKMAGLL